jgi:hypothetical protein
MFPLHTVISVLCCLEGRFENNSTVRETCPGAHKGKAYKPQFRVEALEIRLVVKSQRTCEEGRCRRIGEDIVGLIRDFHDAMLDSLDVLFNFIFKQTLYETQVSLVLFID